MEIAGALAAQLIDELPVLAAIAPYTVDGMRIRDAKELRVKESDRIALVVKNLRAMGAEVVEHEDGMDIPGGQTLRGGVIDSGLDHRIAMAFPKGRRRFAGRRRRVCRFRSSLRGWMSWRCADIVLPHSCAKCCA
jgi:3-phosphoshikimate 1-carboxyvinyltransferase